MTNKEYVAKCMNCLHLKCKKFYDKDSLLEVASRYNTKPVRKIMKSLKKRNPTMAVWCDMGRLKNMYAMDGRLYMRDPIRRGCDQFEGFDNG